MHLLFKLNVYLSSCCPAPRNRDLEKCQTICYCAPEFILKNDEGHLSILIILTRLISKFDIIQFNVNHIKNIQNWFQPVQIFLCHSDMCTIIFLSIWIIFMGVRGSPVDVHVNHFDKTHIKIWYNSIQNESHRRYSK